MKRFNSTLLLALLLFHCQKPVRFSHLKEPDANYAVLYLIRPHLSPPVLRKYRVSLLRYEGHFRQGNPILLQSLIMMNGQFIDFSLPPGFYGLQLEEDPPRILRVASGKQFFYGVDIYDSRLLRKKARLISLSREEALQELLIHDRLTLHPDGSPVKNSAGRTGLH